MKTIFVLSAGISGSFLYSLPSPTSIVPHKGFSVPIFRISAMVSAEIFGCPCDFRRQYTRNNSRCQRRSVRLNDMHGLLPEFGKAAKKHKQEVVLVAKLRSFDLPMQDDQLLAQECILHDQVRTAASYIGEKSRDQHCSGRFCPMFDALLKPEKKIVDHAAPSVLYNEDQAASYPFYSSYPIWQNQPAQILKQKGRSRRQSRTLHDLIFCATFYITIPSGWTSQHKRKLFQTLGQKHL